MLRPFETSYICIPDSCIKCVYLYRCISVLVIYSLSLSHPEKRHTHRRHRTPFHTYNIVYIDMSKRDGIKSRLGQFQQNDEITLLTNIKSYKKVKIKKLGFYEQYFRPNFWWLIPWYEWTWIDTTWYNIAFVYRMQIFTRKVVHPILLYKNDTYNYSKVAKVQLKKGQ